MKPTNAGVDRIARRSVLKGLATGLAGTVAGSAVVTGAEGPIETIDAQPVATASQAASFLDNYQRQTLTSLAESLVPGAVGAGVVDLLDRVASVDGPGATAPAAQRDWPLRTGSAHARTASDGSIWTSRFASTSCARPRPLPRAVRRNRRGSRASRWSSSQSNHRDRQRSVITSNSSARRLPGVFHDRAGHEGAGLDRSERVAGTAWLRSSRSRRTTDPHMKAHCILGIADASSAGGDVGRRHRPVLLGATRADARRQPRKGSWGVQLYTVREQIAKDPAATLQALARIGYTELEILQPTLPVVAPIAKKLGLSIVAAHLDYADGKGRRLRRVHLTGEGARRCVTWSCRLSRRPSGPPIAQASSSSRSGWPG